VVAHRRIHQWLAEHAKSAAKPDGLEQRVRSGRVRLTSIAPASRSLPVCLAAVQRDGSTLRHLYPEQRTPEVIQAAVEQSPWALQFVGEAERTPQLLQAAIERDGSALLLLDTHHRTPALCLAAARQDGWAIAGMSPEERTAPVCLAALQQSLWVLRVLQPHELAYTSVARWINANWAAVVPVMGEERAREIARHILAPRQRNKALNAPASTPQAVRDRQA
jgi:hypothetical protein